MCYPCSTTTQVKQCQLCGQPILKKVKTCDIEGDISFLSHKIPEGEDQVLQALKDEHEDYTDK